MQFSPDGRWLLTVLKQESDSSEVRLWTAATGHPLTAPLRGIGGFDPQAIFTRDDRRCFIIRLGGDSVGWELPTGRVLHLAEYRAAARHPPAVTLDGQRFATLEQARELRVFDAVTGEPLSPALRIDQGQFGVPPSVIFSPDGSQLLTGAEDRAQLWPLPKDTRPVEDLVMLARLLSGRTIDDSGNYAECSARATGDAWPTLRQKHPACFAIAPGQVRAWRERILARAEREEHWFTAAFHLDELVKEQPEDKTLRARRARANNNAAMQELR